MNRKEGLAMAVGVLTLTIPQACKINEEEMCKELNNQPDEPIQQQYVINIESSTSYVSSVGSGALFY